MKNFQIKKRNKTSRFFLLLLILAFTKVEAQISPLSTADSLYAVGAYAEAIKILEEIPSKTEAVQLQLARYYSSNGNFNNSIKYFKQVLEQNPARLLTALEYGKVLTKSGKLDAADSLFHVLRKKYPQNAHFSYQHGLIQEKLKDSAAIFSFSKTIELDEHHEGALIKMAKQNLKEGNFSMAEKFSKQGLKVHQENISLISILGQTYFATKRYDKAIPLYENILLLGHESETVYTKLGYAQYLTEDYKNALKSYVQALEIEDKDSNTHLMLGRLYALTGDLKKSEVHLLMAVLIKDQPMDIEYFNLGYTYQLQKNYKDALKYFNRAIEENPDNERALYERAVAADNYFEDIKTKINYYQAYLNKYDPSGNNQLVTLTKSRMHDLKTDLHLLKE